MNAVEARCLNVRQCLGTGSPFSTSLKTSSKAEGHPATLAAVRGTVLAVSGWLALPSSSSLTSKPHSAVSSEAWLVGSAVVSLQIASVAFLHVLETLSTHLLCNMRYVFDTILHIFCDIFKTFKNFQSGQMFPQQLLMVACLTLSQAVLICNNVAYGDWLPSTPVWWSPCWCWEPRKPCLKLPGVMCLESFYHVLTEGLDERCHVWGHEDNFCVRVGIFELLTAMNWGIIQD